MCGVALIIECDCAFNKVVVLEGMYKLIVQ